jgi:esterase FrsA
MNLRIALFLLVATTASAQTGVAPTRTWQELKQETQVRAERNAYPVAGLPAAEVAEALSRIASLDRDQWAEAFSAIGQRHFERGEYLVAWRFFSFAAWPVTNSPGKREAYRKSVDAFRRYAALSEAPPETVHIPFEGSEIVGYLGLPAGARPAPLVMLIAGLDSRKENGAERGKAYLARGLGYLALDLPGTGESQVKVDADAVRMFARVLDWLQARRDIDATRIAVQGSSWGSHWAARLAFVERARLRAAVVQGGPVHGYFQPDWQRKALQTPEYLFDLFAARAGLYGTGTLDEFLAWGPRLSLQAAGLLDQPSTRMLLVNGEKDSQVPIDDLYLLLHHGTPKEAWVNPQGGHMGRSRDWPDERIFREIVLPWLESALHR